MARRTKRRRRARCRKRRQEKRLQVAQAEAQVSATNGAEIGKLRRFIGACYAVDQAIDQAAAGATKPPPEASD